MAPDAETVKAVARVDGAPVLVIGKRVYDASSLIPSVRHFTRQQYLFLNAYRFGVPLEEAALKSGLAPDEAERFLDRPKTVAWLQDRALKDHIREEWEEPAKWWSYGSEVLEGTREFSKAQIEVWKDFGRRVAPAREAHGEGETKIQINIDPGAVQEAFRRQKAIDAEIAQP